MKQREKTAYVTVNRRLSSTGSPIRAIQSPASRLVSIICAMAILLSCSLFPMLTTSATEYDAAFCEQSFELHPDDAADLTITLDGMMPADAGADAVDVTGEYAEPYLVSDQAQPAENGDAMVLGAYDITITDGDGEYQPDESHPILVEIANPEISAATPTELWHIHDDGAREQITDFTLEDGRIRFYATGFSVYAIVTVPEPFTPSEMELASSLDDLTSSRGSNGFLLYYTATNGRDNYATNTMNSNNCLIETTAKVDAAVWYFEQNRSYYHIYTYLDGVKKYIHTKSGNNIELSDTADLFTISYPAASENTFYLMKATGDRWLQHSNGGGGIRYYTDKNNATNSSIKLGFADTVVSPYDYYQLDGLSYGLMYFSGGTLGSAMMAEGDDNYIDMISLVVRMGGSTDILYVAEDSGITMWTFHCVRADEYTLSAEVGGTTYYLNIAGDTPTLVDESGATIFSVTSNTSNKIRLVAYGKAVAFDGDGFVCVTSSSSDTTQWLHLVELSGLSQNDYITYSADKVSVSEVPDGERVIIYTRVWNNELKTYEFYAVDHNGSLYPCYERGDNIMWVGGVINTLLWDFTEYHNDDGSPNYYYELYNNYSRKYIAPQIRDGQTLSNTTIGINLPGRREGEYYTDILAWDDRYYTYAGLSQDIENGTIAVSSRSDADTFYFATVENPIPTLTQVDTIDNTAYGITMKMIDFPVQPNKTTGESFQNDFLGTGSASSGTYATRGLLSTDLDENGYPTAVRTDQSLAQMFAGDYEVNHLFLESVYNASGYFEFDSCQNFATLVGDDGTRGTDFTVYKELGTTDNTSKTTLSHGQFFPYDRITAGVYSTANPENLYSALADPNDETVGVLPDSDPRKYERLHTVGTNPNYYNGMEMSASFVQTPSGRDSWGHDIIFEFTGDDDFWLYVDGELIIDLGGIHSALAGSVNFATGDVIVNGRRSTLRSLFESNYVARNPAATRAEIDAYLDRYFDTGEVVFKDYSPHTMRIFYMERGAGASNLHMRFNLSYVTPGHVILTKNVSGTEDLEFNLVEYPYQIWYIDEEYGDEHLLRNDDVNINVTYQNSTQRVDYLETYTPPNSTRSYESVYLLHPGRSVEIHFPANTILYKVIECGMNNEVYDVVKVNGEEIEPQSIGNTNRSYFETDWLMVSERPSVVFENHVNESAMRTLRFQKLLYDEQGNELSAEDDPTTFNFRLYLSNGVEDTLELANMYRYYVADPDGRLCRWDAESQTFVSTGYTSYQSLSDELKNQLTYETSMNGAISMIPAGYTVEVPNLLVGTRFMVEERAFEIPVGYHLMAYERESGTYHVEDGDTLNSGWVRYNESPKMYILNRRGFEIEADKRWTDEDFTDGHDPIYAAVYLGDTPVTDTVRKLTYPDTSMRFFFEELAAGATLADYAVHEIEVDSPVIGEDGVTVVAYGSIRRKLNDGDSTVVGAIPKGYDTASSNTYTVSYDVGAIQSSNANLQNIRTDTITNTRFGGVVITLYDMHTREPLSGGVFTLTTGDTALGTFTSDAYGCVTILYGFERNQEYILTETSPPNAYIGLPNATSFIIHNDDSPAVTGNTAEWAAGRTSVSADDEAVAYIEVYNKPLQLYVIKHDTETDEPLSGAHFALYRSVNAMGGALKDFSPLSGYEDLVSSADGVIPLLDNTLPSGKYYLTETAAPRGYERLDEDIIFTVTPLGNMVVDSEAHKGYLVEEDTDVRSYVLSIPNTPMQTALLTVTKTVLGSNGNRALPFAFTMTVDGARSTDTYEWTKNGVEQNDPLYTGGTFTLMHDDEATITLPAGATVTVSESNGEYITRFRLDDDEQDTNTMTFVLEDNATLAVTNTLGSIVPTGVSVGVIAASVLMTASLMTLFLIKRKKYPFPDPDPDEDDENA